VSGGGDNREILWKRGEERRNRQATKARDFEGVGGAEDKARITGVERGGDDGVRNA
jgi:hypothetical protein